MLIYFALGFLSSLFGKFVNLFLQGKPSKAASQDNTLLDLSCQDRPNTDRRANLAPKPIVYDETMFSYSLQRPAKSKPISLWSGVHPLTPHPGAGGAFAVANEPLSQPPPSVPPPPGHPRPVLIKVPVWQHILGFLLFLYLCFNSNTHTHVLHRCLQ